MKKRKTELNIFRGKKTKAKRKKRYCIRQPTHAGKIRLGSQEKEGARKTSLREKDREKEIFLEQTS